MEETKICSCCGKELPLSMFSRNAIGVFSVCNDCITKKKNETRKKNKEERNFEQELTEAKKMRLSEFTPRELAEELYRRGYTGKLKFVQVKEIDISNF